MLPGGLDPLYRASLATAHTPTFRTEVWQGGTRLEPDLTTLGGAVQATLANRVARTYTFSVHESLYPFAIDDLLNPYTNYVKAYRGVQWADGYQLEWQVFRGRIFDVDLPEGGACDVQCSDRAAEVDEAKFVAPENSTVGANVTTEVIRLIADALPDATFATGDTFFEVMPQLTWESERAGALDEIATSAGAFWYPLADGSFVPLRRVPWTVPGAPVLTLSDGEGGTVLGAAPRRSRTTVYNSVTATSERLNGDTPVYAVAQDNNPANPTYIGGNFGVRHRTVALQTPQTQGSALSAAQSYLQRSVALTEPWAWSCVPDPALELGDVVRLDARGQTNIIQVVAGFSLPMSANAAMTVVGRAQVIGSTEE